MAEMGPQKLVIAISSRALFNLDDAHHIFQTEGLEAYSAYQIEKEDLNFRQQTCPKLNPFLWSLYAMTVFLISLKLFLFLLTPLLTYTSEPFF